MVIKSDKGNYFILAVIIVVWTFLISIISHDGISNKNAKTIIFVSLLLFLVVFFCVRYFIFISKTITLTPEGCIIKLFSYKKFYPWSYYKTIRFEPYNDLLSFTQGLYDSKILFLRKRKKNMINPMLYCIFICPFSGFFVNFSDNMHDVPNSDSKGMPRILFADKEQFLNLMSKYQIQIDNLDNL